MQVTGVSQNAYKFSLLESCNRAARLVAKVLLCSCQNVLSGSKGVAHLLLKPSVTAAPFRQTLMTLLPRASAHIYTNTQLEIDIYR